MRIFLGLGIAIGMLSLVGLAEAQPSVTSAGAPNSYDPSTPPGQTPKRATNTYSGHAVPPLPFPTHAPLQSSGPPSGLAPGESSDSGRRGMTVKRPGYHARIEADGSLSFEGRLFESHFDQRGPGATFDIGDILVGALKPGAAFDPYLQDKLDLLHETFAERVDLRKSHNKRVMKKAIAAIPQSLRAIWQHPGWDLPTKRRILFALWDECAEGGSPLVASGGAAARRAIERFIATTLPPGSQTSYSIEELSALNRLRTSTQHFRPEHFLASRKGN